MTHKEATQLVNELNRHFDSQCQYRCSLRIKPNLRLPYYEAGVIFLGEKHLRHPICKDIILHEYAHHLDTAKKLTSFDLLKLEKQRIANPPREREEHHGASFIRCLDMVLEKMKITDYRLHEYKRVQKALERRE